MLGSLEYQNTLLPNYVWNKVKIIEINGGYINHELRLSPTSVLGLSLNKPLAFFVPHLSAVMIRYGGLSIMSLNGEWPIIFIWLFRLRCFMGST
ncbi:hypothetical protein TNIN_478751 [Trichonephila inaurata madagascariensis]|uniref:Uncharacterized protein n=1 Tax=Trichonephila inaurata madagascariensis TaxID=2747483 RepID=A0A8X7CC00_9ARAC|nr:hypothetical protein TNIN_478751 [Trichonephila inaurata madagascariensis]